MDSLFKKVASKDISPQVSKHPSESLKENIFAMSKIVLKDYYLLEFDRLKMSAAIIYNSRKDLGLVSKWPKMLEEVFGMQLKSFNSESEILEGRIISLEKKKQDSDLRRLGKSDPPTVCDSSKIQCIEKIALEQKKDALNTSNSLHNPLKGNSIVKNLTPTMMNTPNNFSTPKYFQHPYQNFTPNENLYNFQAKSY